MPHVFLRRGLIAAAAVALPLALTQAFPAQAAQAGRSAQPAAMARAGALATAGPLIIRKAGGGDGCNPNRGDNFPNPQFDGWQRTPGGTVGGVYADVYNYSPWVHYITSKTSYVSAWVAVTNNGSWYGQIGWIELPRGARYVFDETESPAQGDVVHYFGSEPINSQVYYTVLYGNTPGYLTYEVAGKGIDSEPAGFTPVNGQTTGETHSAADQMPGGYNQNEYFTDSHIYYSGGWHNFSGSMIPGTQSFYGHSIPSSTELLIWDKACAN